MNEFVAFLRVLWEIVKFLLDLVTYILCFVLASVACLLPWRAIAISGLLCKGDLSRGRCVFEFFRTLGEAIGLAVCLPSLIIPSRLAGFYHLMKVHGKALTHSEDDDDEEFPPYLFYWYGSPFMGIAELVALVFSLFSILSVVRSGDFVDEVKKANVSSNWNDALYNAELVGACVACGYLALIDLLLLPLLLVLGVTVWRAGPVLAAMRKRSRPEMARAIVFRQFARLLADILLAGPAAVLVALTVYRLPGLVRALRRGPPDSELARLAALEESELAGAVCDQAFSPEYNQRQCMRSGGLILLDLACLPMLLPLLGTGYRARAVTGGLEGTAFHEAVLEQFGELALDAPFLLAGFLVVCSVYRADLVLRLLRSDAGRAWDRREAAGRQFLRVLGDVASLLPLAVILGTVYRVCPLALSLKAGMARMLREDAEMQLREWEFNIPRPKGKPRFVARAARSPNLGGVTSMQLQVAGDGFWAALAETHGGMKAAVGRAMLPLRLKDGKEVNFSSLERGRADAELVIELDFNVKQSTVLKFLRTLPADVELLLQVEATLQAEGREERKAVLLAIPCRLGDLMQAVSSEDARFSPQEDAEAAAERLATLRGAPKLRRDVWLPLVLAEFLQVVVDFAHLLIALLLLAVPWRFALAVVQFLEPAGRREARPVRKAAAALQGWDEACLRIMAKGDRLANRYSKAAAEEAIRQTCHQQPRLRPYDRRGEFEQGAEDCVGCCCCLFCPCCPNYNDWDTEDFEVMRSDGRYIGRKGQLERDFDSKLKQLAKSLTFFRTLLAKARKAWPDSPAWEELAGMIDGYLQRRSEAFFWMFLLHEVHILAAKRSITPEEHARVAQAIRIRASPLVLAAKGDSGQLQEALRLQTQAASAEGECGIKGKGKALLFSILRGQLKRAATDLLALLLVLLLLVTGYRLPKIWQEMSWSTDFAYVKAVVQREAACVVLDLMRLTQLFLLTVLLVATVVKLPDFLSQLRPAQGLRKARDCALAAAVELAVGLGELLLMLTAWKTYRLLVSAAVFGALCPAAMLALAFPCADAFTTRGRFALASACWLGLVVASGLAPGAAVLAVLFVLMALAFLGFCLNRVAGWTKPRGGQDWWSPVVRCTFFNLLAVLAVAGDAAALAWEGLQPGAIGRLGTATSTPALVVAGLTVLLETIPMVSDEDEQSVIVNSHPWRFATTVCKEVLFFPLALSLAPAALESPLECVLLVFYLAVALLGPAAWDIDLPRESQLDIRCVGLAASGRRLLLLGAVAASALSKPGLFVALAAASGVWALAWAPCGCTSLWPELLRLGASAGAIAAMASSRPGAELKDWTATFVVWGCACMLALGAGVGSWVLRRRRLAASKVPAALARLEELQQRLCLWGGEALPTLRADADVRSTAERLLEFEERLPMERLDFAFFAERHAWRRDLTDAKDYDTLLAHIQKLTGMIREPVTRVLLRQVLASVPTSGSAPHGRKLGQAMAGEIIAFTIPQVSITLPPPLKGWEYGKLDLAELRSAAAAKAHNIPESIHSQAARGAANRPKTIGRSLVEFALAMDAMEDAMEAGVARRAPSSLLSSDAYLVPP